ncbi:MAG: lysylphosphatidylglycerol synthase domain-containing protein [Nannocystaceae bacterium]
MTAANAARVPWLRLVVSLVLGVALLVLVWPLMAAVPADPGIAPVVLLGFAGLLLPYHGLRALRWWFLLRRVGEVPWRSAITIGLVGYMWIALLPLRLGELVRPWLVAQRHGVALGRTLAVVALERITDGFVVAALFFRDRAIAPARARRHARAAGRDRRDDLERRVRGGARRPGRARALARAVARRCGCSRAAAWAR